MIWGGFSHNSAKLRPSCCQKYKKINGWTKTGGIPMIEIILANDQNQSQKRIAVSHILSLSLRLGNLCRKVNQFQKEKKKTIPHRKCVFQLSPFSGSKCQASSPLVPMATINGRSVESFPLDRSWKKSAPNLEVVSVKPNGDGKFHKAWDFC